MHLEYTFHTRVGRWRDGVSVTLSKKVLGPWISLVPFVEHGSPNPSCQQVASGSPLCNRANILSSALIFENRQYIYTHTQAQWSTKQLASYTAWEACSSCFRKLTPSPSEGH